MTEQEQVEIQREAFVAGVKAVCSWESPEVDVFTDLTACLIRTYANLFRQRYGDETLARGLEALVAPAAAPVDARELAAWFEPDRLHFKTPGERQPRETIVCRLCGKVRVAHTALGGDQLDARWREEHMAKHVKRGDVRVVHRRRVVVDTYYAKTSQQTMPSEDRV